RPQLRATAEALVPLQAGRTRSRMDILRQPAAGVLYRSQTGRLPLPCRCEQQRWRLERSRRDPRSIDRSDVLPDLVVRVAVRADYSRTCAVAGTVAHSIYQNAAARQTGRTTGRARTDRA